MQSVEVRLALRILWAPLAQLTKKQLLDFLQVYLWYANQNKTFIMSYARKWLPSLANTTSGYDCLTSDLWISIYVIYILIYMYSYFYGWFFHWRVDLYEVQLTGGLRSKDAAQMLKTEYFQYVHVLVFSNSAKIPPKWKLNVILSMR